jgi:hypothetical protein
MALKTESTGGNIHKITSSKQCLTNVIEVSSFPLKDNVPRIYEIKQVTASPKTHPQAVSRQE